MPNINVLNEIQIKQDNNTTTSYKVGTVNGYYNPTNGKFYKEYPYVNEIEGASNLVYVDLGGNKLYIYKNSSFVNVSGSGGGSDNIVFGYYKEADGKFYEDSSYTTEIVPNLKNLYINLIDEAIFRYDATNSEYIEIGETNASGINYDNTTSGLTANNVQNAIDEVNSDLNGKAKVKVQTSIIQGNDFIYVLGVGATLVVVTTNNYGDVKTDVYVVASQWGTIADSLLKLTNNSSLATVTYATINNKPVIGVATTAANGCTATLIGAL